MKEPLFWITDQEEQSTTAFLAVCIIMLLVGLAGFITVLSDLLVHKWVITAVICLNIVMFLGTGVLTTSSIDVPFFISSGVYVSTVLWDSRNFIIDSFKWRNHLMRKSFYFAFPLLVILISGNALGYRPTCNWWLMAGQIVSSIILSELSYSVCKRRKYLNSAWRTAGNPALQRYDSRFSSTLTTPTSDRSIRI